MQGLSGKEPAVSVALEVGAQAWRADPAPVVRAQGGRWVSHSRVAMAPGLELKGGDKVGKNEAQSALF